MKDLQTLKFYCLRYEVSAIEELIDSSDGIDNFVFSYYYPAADQAGKPLQLVAYAHMVNSAYPDGIYSTYYDTLSIDDNKIEEICGPVILSNNILSLAQMLELIDYPEKPDYLILVPNVNSDRHIYYSVEAHYNNASVAGNTAQKTALFGPPPKNTNPSPPAT
ncbi:hypothetical protein AY601_1514 [Pedobacter cryoconitis]|uniref:Uncharacterized protein n=1 Tax=Pedobacter cryoconitis TaxID=188932 RepID=A0A127VB85_9SPHI|nr:hypothetical protein [Pedobacter cryoconitis]AMP98431.1 hypothetical protein AY601_1514 [Pedobacter cryoconitis]